MTAPATQRAARIRDLAPELLGTLIGLRNELSGTPRPAVTLALIAAADRVIAQANGESA